MKVFISNILELKSVSTLLLTYNRNATYDYISIPNIYLHAEPNNTETFTNNNTAKQTVIKTEKILNTRSKQRENVKYNKTRCINPLTH